MIRPNRWAGGARVLPALLAAVVPLAGCGPNDTDPGPGGVTVGEARALDEAAEMLDEQRLPEDALTTAQPATADEDAPPAAPEG